MYKIYIHRLRQSLCCSLKWDTAHNCWWLLYPTIWSCVLYSSKTNNTRICAIYTRSIHAFQVEMKRVIKKNISSTLTKRQVKWKQNCKAQQLWKEINHSWAKFPLYCSRNLVFFFVVSFFMLSFLFIYFAVVAFCVNALNENRMDTNGKSYVRFTITAHFSHTIQKQRPNEQLKCCAWDFKNHISRELFLSNAFYNLTEVNHFSVKIRNKRVKWHTISPNCWSIYY